MKSPWSEGGRRGNFLHSHRAILYLVQVTLMLVAEKSGFGSQWEGHLVTCGAPWNSLNAWSRIHELLRGSSDAS